MKEMMANSQPASVEGGLDTDWRARTFFVDPALSVSVSYGRVLWTAMETMETMGSSEPTEPVGLGHLLGGKDPRRWLVFYACLLRAMVRGQTIDLVPGPGSSPGADVKTVWRELWEAWRRGDERAGSRANLLQGRRRYDGGGDGDAPWRKIERRGGTKVRLVTSGSTGRPREVTQTVRDLARLVRRNGGQRSSRWGLTYHGGHVAAVQVFLQAIMNGNPLVHLHGLEPEATREAIRKWEVTHVSGTPTFYRQLVTDKGRPLRSVRRITFGGEPFDAGLERKARLLFPRAKVLNVYGSTEAGPLLVSEDAWFRIPDRLRSQVRVVKGELQIHRSLVGAMDHQSGKLREWYRTGDKVELRQRSPAASTASGDESGCWFRFCRRSDGEINVGGLKVDPELVENVLHAHPGVAASRVYGRPSAVTGQVLGAEVVACDWVSEDALRRYLRERLEPFEVPRVWRFVSGLATTRSGKRLLSGNDEKESVHVG